MDMRELDIFPIPDTLTSKEEIVGVMVQDMEVGPRRSTTSPCSLLEKVLMVLVELDIGLRPALLHPIIKVIMVDIISFIVMMITEVDICITPANFCI